VATKAQIQVSVAGFKQLQNLQASVKALAPQIDQANAAFIRFSGASQKTLPIISNFSRVLRENQKLFASTILSNKEAVTAARNQTLAEKELNNELARRNAVLNKARGIKSDPIAKSIARNRAKFSDDNAPAFENIRDLPSGSKRPSRFAQFSQDATKISAPRSPVEAKIQADLKNQKRITQEIADIRSRSAKKIEASNKRVEASLKKRKKILEDSRKEEIKAQTRIEKIRSKDSVRRKRDFLNRPDIKIRRGLTGRSAQARATRQRAAGSALIGGGFPLLFGGGPLQALAGGLGGGIGELLGKGGGFAGSIAATAIAQTIQQAITAISELGQALGPFTQDTQAATAAMGLQGSAQEAQLKRIERTQGKTAAFNAAMKMMENRIGQSGVQKIKEFGETTRILGTIFGTAMLRLQAFAAGVANFVAKLLAGEDKLKEADINKSVEDAAAGGNEEAKALLAREEEIEKTGYRRVGHGGHRRMVKFGTKQKVEELKRDKEIFAIRNKISLANDEVTSKSQTLVEEKRKEFELNEKIKNLVDGGMNPALAKSLATVEQTFDAEQKILEEKAKQAELDFNKAKDAGVEKEKLTEIEDIFNAHTLELEKHNKLRKEAVDLTEDLHDQTDLVGKAFEELSLSINNDIKEGIKGLIKGTSTLGDMLNNIADRFLDIALNQALFGSILGSKGDKGGGLLGAIGLFANGGRPPVGKPSIVGEKGPELFVPRSSGTIVPNNKLGGGGSTSVVVNVDASGSDVQGDEAGAKELGTLISVAVQGELLKQQRPGGLLSSLR
tara:strand:- start:1033 stop:3390 length:2358 start_codon:yes stop_codon:yes gene_type:complete